MQLTMLARMTLTVFAFPVALIAQNIWACADCSIDANNVAQHLSLNGFNCNFDPVSSARGFRCQGAITGYSQPIDIFIPPRLALAQKLAVAYHLHGWWQTPQDSPFIGNNGDYGAFLAATQLNLILVIPESRGKNKTYQTDLDTADRVNSWLEQSEIKLMQAGVPLTMSTPRLLSGHSGAYVALGPIGTWTAAGQIPRFKSLKGLALIDSVYGFRQGLVDFMSAMCANTLATEKFTYLLTYNPNDGSTSKRKANLQILNEISTSHNCAQAKIVHQPDPATVHVVFPSRHLGDFYLQALQ